MTSVVLDASALLALLLGEPGADNVRRVLPDSAISVVNLAEVIGHFARNGVEGDDIRQVIDPLPIERIPFDEEYAYAVGLLVPLTQRAGLSFGDRACLALASRLALPALTADRAWRGIASTTGVVVDVIR